MAGTDAGKAGFITALYVVLVPLFGLFFRRKVSGPVWIAVVLSVVSLYLLCIKGGFSLAPGDLLVLVCAVCFAVHILLIDHFTARCDGVKLSCLQFLFAAIWSTILALIFDTIDFHVLWECILPLLYVGVFSCGVGYTLQILAQKDSNPTVVTILLSGRRAFLYSLLPFQGFMRRSSSTSIFQTRCTEEMDIFSRKVWISFRSGPKDTQSSPGSLAENSPHSRPAWMASTLGS